MAEYLAMSFITLLGTSNTRADKVERKVAVRTPTKYWGANIFGCFEYTRVLVYGNVSFSIETAAVLHDN